MALKFGGSILGQNDVREFESEVPSGEVKQGSWWGNQEIFDNFEGTNGDLVDSDKWTTTLSSADATITIQGNNCRIQCTADNADESAVLELKTALTSGSLAAMFVPSGAVLTNCTTDMDKVEINIYVGNDTDGWTNIFQFEEDRHDGALNPVGMPLMDAEFTAVDEWTVNVNGVEHASSPFTLPTGFKFKVEVLFEFDGGGSFTGDLQAFLDRVYIKSN